jgi:hypothetical protein
MLPNGPHIAEVRARIAAIEAKAAARDERELREDERIAATQTRLAEADASRRAFVTALKDWAARLARIETFGEPTSALDDETIFAFRLSEPRGSCVGDRCRKLLQLEFEVPGRRQLLSRVAVLEVDLELEQGMLRKARLAGPELWTRLAEALRLEPLESPSAEQRADAINRSLFLVRAVLEQVLPAQECEAKAELPVVLSRACRGLQARKLAGQSPAEDDALEIWAAPAPAPAAP